MLLITACDKDETEKTEDLQGSAIFSTRGDATDGVSVLIFKEKQGVFGYDETWNPDWRNGKAIRILDIEQDYRFLLYKWEKGTVTMSPSPLEKTTTKMEDIRFDAKADAQAGAGYVLPVDSIWLPKDLTTAEEKFRFNGVNNKTVKETLELAVSCIELELKRGYRDGNSYKPLVYDNPAAKNILSEIKNISLDIAKVGTSVDIEGGIGTTSKTAFSTKAGKVDKDGFANIIGPLVFPNEKKEESDVKITLDFNDDSSFPKTMSTSVKGLLERNNKLVITLWLSVTYETIEISVDVKPISATTDGDDGMWD